LFNGVENLRKHINRCLLERRSGTVKHRI
jgi:hypothetical protein